MNLDISTDFILLGPQSLPVGITALVFAIALIAAMRTYWVARNKIDTILILTLAVLLCFSAFDSQIVEQRAKAAPLRANVVYDTSASVWIDDEDPKREIQNQSRQVRKFQGALFTEVLEFVPTMNGIQRLNESEDSLNLLQHTFPAQDLQSIPEADVIFLIGDGRTSVPDGFQGKLVHVARPAANQYSDIAISSASAEAIGLIRNHAKVQFEIRYRNVPKTQEIQLEVLDNFPIVQTSVTVPKGSGIIRTNLPILVEKLGEQELVAGLKNVPSWDAIELNNSRGFTVNGYREKIRVLLISGAPGADTKSIRTMLKNDPAVELMHFSILRRRENNPKAPNSQLSLIPFPYHDLFTKSLPQFDAVVLQNFNYAPYFRNGSTLYFQNLERAVRQSGVGLIVTGGKLSMGNGNYRDPKIQKIMGVEFRPKDYEKAPFDSFSVKSNGVPSSIPLLDLEYFAFYNDVAVKSAKEQKMLSRKSEGNLEYPEGSEKTFGSAEEITVLTYNQYFKGRAVGVYTPDFFLRSTGKGQQELSHWMHSTLRWVISDSSSYPFSVTVSEQHNSLDTKIHVQNRDTRIQFNLNKVEIDPSIDAQPSDIVQPMQSDQNTALQFDVSSGRLARATLRAKTDSETWEQEWIIDPYEQERNSLSKEAKTDLSWEEFIDLNAVQLQEFGVKSVEAVETTRDSLSSKWYFIALIVSTAFLLFWRQRNNLFLWA